LEFFAKILPPRVSPNKTQPIADELIDYRKLKEILGEIEEQSPRVEVFVGGRSCENRNIYYLVISSPENIKKLYYYKKLAKRLSGPKIRHHTLDDIKVEEPNISELAKKAKVTVLMHAASFGFEAAQTEALVKVAKTLATSEEPLVKRILEKEIITIIPMMNPDGREMAIEEWRKHSSLSDGRLGVGNSRGALLNRDFNRLAEPETTAVHRIFNEWSPVVAYDPHEDMVSLGINPDWPELCWCPPFAGPYHKDLDKGIINLINELGGVIAKRWEKEGFKYRYHPRGEGALLSHISLGGERFDLHFDLHGTPTIITESARTPGTNTWEERINQKVTAALAILEHVAENSLRYIQIRYDLRREHIKKDKEAFIIPVDAGKQKDLLAVSMLIENLIKHYVQIYYTEKPFKSYVIPLNQPERPIVSELLSIRKWNIWTLPPAFGVTVYKLGALRKLEREKFMRAKLSPVDEPPIRKGRFLKIQ
jgi:hypothetical protein